MLINPKLKAFLCFVVLPASKLAIQEIEDDVERSKTKLDDIGLAVAKGFVKYLEYYVCKESK